MPVEAKPLFRRDVLRPRLKEFPLPDRIETYREKMINWGEMIASSRIDGFKEEEILDDFVNDFFYGVLGYTRAVDSAHRFTIRREKYIQVDGKFADAVIGEFLPGSNRFVAAVEGKGPKDPLERPFNGRRKSAVDQGYGYAINLPCDWVIITSIRQTRLYYKSADQQSYERFDTEALVGDDAQLRKFVYLLGAERVVPATGKCHLYDLLSASERVGKELTKEFYILYAGMRENAFEHLCRSNPETQPPQVLEATQKLLDRVLFCAFCEDRELLPEKTIEEAYKHDDPYNPKPMWDNFRGLFRAVNTGSTRLRIPAYNGGLFAEDPILDGLTVPDEVCTFFKDLADYDYRPPHEASYDDLDKADGETKPKLVDVDILGHIFEQSITDLEVLLDELEGRTKRLDQSQHTSRRKKEGAFYTRPFITRFILEQALGKVLDERFEALRMRHAAEAEGTARQSLADPRSYDLEKLNRPQQAVLVRFWEFWQEELSVIRILDPACGSGAFLIEGFDQLHRAYQQSNDRLEELRGHRTLFDLDRQILQNNLYGVDLNEEAVQICRLSLWIKTAERKTTCQPRPHHPCWEQRRQRRETHEADRLEDGLPRSESWRAWRWIRCRNRQPALHSRRLADEVQGPLQGTLQNLRQYRRYLRLLLRTRLQSAEVRRASLVRGH